MLEPVSSVLCCLYKHDCGHLPGEQELANQHIWKSDALLRAAGVHASADGAEVATPVSLVEWFLNFYAAAQEGATKPVEGIVRAGEVLFVPRGWWHLAINLEVRLALVYIPASCLTCAGTHLRLQDAM